jgi:hypothetical protein
MHNFEQQKVGLQWIKWYDHLSCLQDAKIQTRLNVTLYLHLLTCINNDTSGLKMVVYAVLPSLDGSSTA